MSYPSQLIIANGAAVNQTWNRDSIEKGVARYINDTARSAGIDEKLWIRASDNLARKSVAAALPTMLGKWNLKITSLLSTETEPVTSNFTHEITKSLSAVPASARSRVKDHRAVYVALSDTDAEVDDITAFRTI